MNNKLINSFRFYPRIVGYTYTDLPSYISIVKNLVKQHNERVMPNYDVYNHVSPHLRVNQIYTNLHKNK